MQDVAPQSKPQLDTMKPIHLYSHRSGPNPWRVAIILEELGLPYETEFMDMSVLHTPVFEKVCDDCALSKCLIDASRSIPMAGKSHSPVLRDLQPTSPLLTRSPSVPAIHDPNTDITIWESGAILLYLIDTYDKEHKLSPSAAADKYHAQQWLFFQASGQGPYFGQFAWFSFYHPEKLPSAVARYRKEIVRVTKVLDRALEGKDYLVADRATYADLAFVTWYGIAKATGLEEELTKENPSWAKWIEKLRARPAVAKVLADKDKAVAEEKK